MVVDDCHCIMMDGFGKRNDFSATSQRRGNLLYYLKKEKKRGRFCVCSIESHIDAIVSSKLRIITTALHIAAVVETKIATYTHEYPVAYCRGVALHGQLQIWPNNDVQVDSWLQLETISCCWQENNSPILFCERENYPTPSPFATTDSVPIEMLLGKKKKK